MAVLESLPESLVGLLAGMEAHFRQTNRPWVTLTYAQSLDGSIAENRNAPLALSGPASLEVTHHLRAAHAAILIGIGTLLADDPRLDARLVTGENPQPVVLDDHLRTPPDARLFQGEKPPWIFTAQQAAPEKGTALVRAGARLFRPSSGRVALPEVLAALGKEGVSSLMVEGGAGVITAFLQARLVDALILTIAPVLVGGLRAVEQTLTDLPRLDSLGVHRLGDDLLVWGRPRWARTEA